MYLLGHNFLEVGGDHNVDIFGDGVVIGVDVITLLRKYFEYATFNLPVLATINTKLSRKEKKTTTIHQQKQDSTRINQQVLETTEKTTENHSIGTVDSSSSINISHVEDSSSSFKLFQVDESNTKQDILQKKYSNK